MTQINRRKLLAAMAAGAGGIAASSMLGMPAFAQDKRIRHFWWGNPERDKRTFEVIDIFQKAHPGVEVNGESISWSDYWTKMATQTAGHNMADLVQMDYRYLFEYVRRGALLPLDDYFGKTLHLDGFDQSALDGGIVDGKLYALNIGSNSQVGIFNTKMVQDAGVEFEPIGWSYDDLKRVAKAITDSTPDGVYGSDDLSLVDVNLEDWVQQKGHNFYDADGKVQTSPDEVAEFWTMWKDMRDEGIVSPAEITVGLIGSKMNESGVVTGQTAVSWMWSNQIVGVQSLMKDTVGAAMLPKVPGGTAPGQFIKPSMFMSLTRDTKDPELATTYMNAWVNDPEETAVLGLERGIPANPEVRKALAPSFTPAEQISVDYFNAIQGKVGKLPPPQPKGAGEVSDAFIRIGTDVLLGNSSIQDGASQFIDEANSIIERAA